MIVYIDGKDYGKEVGRNVKIKIGGTTFTLTESYDSKLMIHKSSADDCHSIRIHTRLGSQIDID